MTRPLELAERYMDSFFGRAPLEAMTTLFADDLVFEGPFHQFISAREYMDMLRRDPPENAHYVLEKTYEDENSVCMIYMFSKPGVQTRMVQTFEIAGDKICRIKLVFDTGAFA
jgi:hypothetical protein